LLQTLLDFAFIDFSMRNERDIFLHVDFRAQERRTKYERGVARSMQRAQQMEMDDYDDEPRPSIAEDPEYDNAATLRDRKRQAKEEKYARGPGTIAVPEEDVSGKREIGHTIMNNRGLTPHRSKETKNPRVRLRGKHARAVTRRKGAVRDVKEGSTAYGGELTGVKTSVVKSRKF
jgi:U3 small nucleolar RNA-associated protein 3